VGEDRMGYYVSWVHRGGRGFRLLLTFVKVKVKNKEEIGWWLLRFVVWSLEKWWCGLF